MHRGGKKEVRMSVLFHLEVFFSLTQLSIRSFKGSYTYILTFKSYTSYICLPDYTD